MALQITEVTDPAGTVHLRVSGDGQTVCCQAAASWSTAVTLPMLTGLVLRCADCDPFAGIPNARDEDNRPF